MISRNDGQSALDAAKQVLKEILKQFPLGSSNIKAIVHDPFSDNVTLYPSLIEKPATLRFFDALIDSSITELAKRRIDATRLGTKQVINEVKPLPIEQQRVIVRSYLASQAEATYSGNCEELATSAFMKLLDIYTGKIELVYFKNIDHTFLVLNRQESSDFSAWKTWGENTIILDPWIRKVFPASDMGQVWKRNHWQIPPSQFVTVVKFDDSAFRPKTDNKNTL